MMTPSAGLLGLDGLPMDFNTPRLWVAMRARPRREQDAADWLRQASMFAYWPCFLRQENAGRLLRNGFAQRRPRYSALIPGYLFIAARRGGMIDPSLIVSQTPGLVGFVRDASGYPMTLGERDIESIRHIEATANLPPRPEAAHKYKIGDKVRFVDDIYGRLPIGTVSRLDSDGQISVEVALLGRIVPISAFPHQIEAM